MKILAVLYRAGAVAKKEPRLLGCVENELGLRKWLESQGHQFIVTDSKEGPGNVLDKELPTTDILITTPFHPGYVTAERIAKAPNLKLCVTAGVGSDHVDLNAANKAKITVAEVTGSNVQSVAEHVMMTILILLKNYNVAHEQIIRGEWNVAEVASRSFDLEGKVVGTVGAGRIGYRVLERLKPFGCKDLLYYDYQPLKPELEALVGAKRETDLKAMLSKCDVVTINCPLHEKTKGLFDKDLIASCKKGAYIVNTARGAIVQKSAILDAINSGHIAGYGGDVWDVQPAPKDHIWRTMPYNAMTPHVSGTTLDAQARYAAGVKDILERYFQGRALKPEDVIVQGGAFASKAYVQPN